MTHSRVPHVSLTEPVRKTMSGKGREGKGREGKGSSWSSNTTSSGYVTREPGDALVSATRLDVHTDLATVEHLDFEPTCENKFCEDGRPIAVVFVEEVPCWSCGDVQPEPFEFECKRCIDRYLHVGSCCGECSTSLDFDETLQIIRWLS